MFVDKEKTTRAPEKPEGGEEDSYKILLELRAEMKKLNKKVSLPDKRYSSSQRRDKSSEKKDLQKQKQDAVSIEDYAKAASAKRQMAKLENETDVDAELRDVLQKKHCAIEAEDYEWGCTFR